MHPTRFASRHRLRNLLKRKEFGDAGNFPVRECKKSVPNRSVETDRFAPTLQRSRGSGFQALRALGRIP